MRDNINPVSPEGMMFFTIIATTFSKAMFTLYQIVKWSIAESVLDRASVHTRNAVFEAFSAPEQHCSAPLLKVELSVSDRFLQRSESSVNTFIGAEFAIVLVNNLFKSKGSAANCMTDRASVHTGNSSEQLLHHNRTLIPVHTVPEQLLKWSKNLSGTV